MDNRDAILKSMDKIAQLSRLPGNEWLFKEFIKHYCPEETIGNAKLDEIYEYCIEKVIKGQAEDFYKDMPLKDIVPQLESDFVKMERAKRRDDFDEFALSVYQQIECMTNEVLRLTNLREIATEMLNEPAYYRMKKVDDEWKLVRTGGFSIGDYLFGKERMEKIKVNKIDEFLKYANEKIACVEYFVCFNAKFQEPESKYFKEYKDLYYEIYQFRNLNHRGGVVTDYQKNIIDRIRPSQSKYYLKFLKALEFYVSGVCNCLAKGFEIEIE